MKPIIIILALLFIVPVLKGDKGGFVFAGNDITITCNTGSACSKSTELPLFYETNIYPGFTHSQKFSIDNNRQSACSLTLKAVSTANVPELLSKKIFIDITGTNNTYNLANYSLNDLLSTANPPASLGHVNKNTKNNYLWSVTLSPDVGNDYQNLISNFNLNFNFECDENIADNPPNIFNNPTSNQGTANCNNSAPSAPTGFRAVKNANGSITLHWTHSSSIHTGYLIAFGTSPGIYQYGAPNIGNVDHYTVLNLTYGAQYCFYVRSLNGCMPGGRTPEYCVNPAALLIPANTIPPGFQPNVLGENTANTSNSGLIAGKSINSCFSLKLLILLVTCFLINLVYLLFAPQTFVASLTPLIIFLAYVWVSRHLFFSECFLISTTLAFLILLSPLLLVRIIRSIAKR